MATPTSGEISISDLQNLYSPVRTAPGSLGDYYAGGSVVAAGERLGGGPGAAIPSSGELSLSNFYDLRATVHGAPFVTASTAAAVFDGIDVSWTADTDGESANTWQVGWRPSPSTDAYTYISTDYLGSPITSTSATVTIPSTPGGTLHEVVVRGVNSFGTGINSIGSDTAYKKAPTADYVYDSPINSTVGAIAGQGISTMHVYAAVGAGGATGTYMNTGGDGTGGSESPFSYDSGYWWWPHYAYQVDMSGAGGGGAGAIAYYPTTIPVTPSTPVTITVGQATTTSGGTTTVNVGGTNYVVAGGGAVGGSGGLVTGGAPGSPAGLPSTYIPISSPSTSSYSGATNGPQTTLNWLQKGYTRSGWDHPINPTVPIPSTTTEPAQLTNADRAMYALGYATAGDGGAGGSVTTGTDARSPTHTNSGDGYAGTSLEHNRPISAWPGTFGAMHGAGAVGYSITVPNTSTVPGLPGFVPIQGPAYPGSGSLTVNKGYGGNWKAPAFPSVYGKIYYDGSALSFGAATFPGHEAFNHTPFPVVNNPTYSELGGGGFAWVRFNGTPGTIPSTNYSEYTSPTQPGQHSANGISVPSSGHTYFSKWHAYPPTGPAYTDPNSFATNHMEPPAASGYGASIGGGPALTPTPLQTNKTQKVTYFPLVSSSGVAVDPGTLGQTQTFTNHAVTISPDKTNYAYSAGGYGLFVPGSTDEGMQTAISRFVFPSTSITSSVATLSTGRAGHFGFSLGVSNQGYVGGGWTGGITGSQTAVNTMERFAFPSEATATEPNNIDTARMSGASGASMDYGYVIAGRSEYPANAGNVDYDHVTKFTGASGSTSVSKTDLAEYPVSGQLLAWSTNGYVMTSDQDQTGFATIPLASGQKSVGYGELRDRWYGTLRNNGFFSPSARDTEFAGTAVSGKYSGFTLTSGGRIERFPFASGYVSADSTTELTPASTSYGYGYGAPGVG